MTVLDYPEDRYDTCDLCEVRILESQIIDRPILNVEGETVGWETVCRDEEACRRRRNEN